MSSFHMPIGNINNSTDVKIGDNRVTHEYITVNTSQVFRKVSEAIPVEEREAVVEEAIRPLEEMAALPPEAQKEPDVQERAASLYQRLTPYMPIIGKALLDGSLAGLSALANTNPILAGLIAACQAIKTSTEK